MGQESTAAAEVRQLEERALRAAQAGRAVEAQQAWKRVVELDAGNARALDAVGDHAFRTGDLAVARDCYERLVKVDGRDAQQWINLAIVRQRLGDERGEEEALRGALSLDPADLLALLLRGQMLERQGRMHEAAQAYGAAATVSPPLDRLHPDLRPAVGKAIAYHADYGRRLSEFLDAHLAAAMRAHGSEDLRRFRDSVDIFLGRKRRYDSQPTVFHVPHLAPIEFFPRDGSPGWMPSRRPPTRSARNSPPSCARTRDSPRTWPIPRTSRSTSGRSLTIRRAGAPSTS
jgi:Cytochrome c biogenesis factor